MNAASIVQGRSAATARYGAYGFDLVKIWHSLPIPFEFIHSFNQSKAPRQDWVRRR